MDTRRPKTKYLKRFGLLASDSTARGKAKPGRKKTDYGLRLEEKQKLKLKYGLRESQLKRYIREALRTQGPLGEVLLRNLETRLDNVVYLLGIANTRPQARQLVGHAHILVNGKKINIPSANLKPGDILEVKEKISNNEFVKENLKVKKPQDLPGWLSREDSRGKMVRYPQKDELPRDVEISAVLAFYR